jgi:hypothetical protein
MGKIELIVGIKRLNSPGSGRVILVSGGTYHIYRVGVV